MTSQLKTSASKHIPGEPGVWVFIFGDLMVFGVLFCTFSIYRSFDRTLFAQAQEMMNQGLGFTNTLLLLTSSWLVALGVRFARNGRFDLAPRFFIGAIACGISFGIVKIIEYSEKISAGITLNSNDFFMLYYMLTGIHFVHVLIGMLVLVYLCRVARRPARISNDITVLESGASFWHLIDILWIVLFALFYLVR